VALVRLLGEGSDPQEVDAVKYVLLFCGTREAQRAYDAMTPDELRPRLAEVGRWFHEYGGRIVDSHQLQPPDTATTVHHASGAEPMVTDGPFLEGNEVIGGYAVVDVDELDDALAMARRWPGGGSVEIRPIVSRPA
jgi:hypothetical protein